MNEVNLNWPYSQSLDIAKQSYDNWIKFPHPIMAKQVGITSLDGNYHIWRETFKNHPEVLIEIDKAYIEAKIPKK
jgi:hypothetical protein